MQLAGIAQGNRESVHATTSRLPLVFGIIAGITLFLLTGSVVVPVKAVVLDILSLTATFGALVWVFQDGRLGALGATVTDTLEVDLPVLMFCIAFGLSMDYEVFLISRIREYWLQSDRTSEAHTESVALGVARTGPVNHRGLNWWSPKPLVRVHERFGLSETARQGTTDASPPLVPA